MKEKGILYLIADRKLGDEKILEALAAGLDMIQLREKNLSSAEYLRDAKWLCEKANEAGALFLVNDRLDIALACGADGVHLGQDDLPVSEAKRLLSWAPRQKQGNRRKKPCARAPITSEAGRGTPLLRSRMRRRFPTRNIWRF